MLRSLYRARIRSRENQLGGSLEYLRHILRVSLRSFLKFTKILPLAEYRRELPAAPYHVARIVACRDEDCGTCLQMEVQAAHQAGVATSQLQAVLDRRPDELPVDLATVYRFTEAVVTASGTEDELRQQVRHQYGEAAFVELALAIAICRVFPITKRALGYAVRCADVTIGPQGV